MDLQELSRQRFFHTVLWAILVSICIVAFAAALGRATINIKAALTSKPDLALYLLLPEEGITHAEFLREEGNLRDYLVETAEGMKLVRLKRGESKWYVSEVEALHE